MIFIPKIKVFFCICLFFFFFSKYWNIFNGILKDMYIFMIKLTVTKKYRCFFFLFFFLFFTWLCKVGWTNKFGPYVSSCWNNWKVWFSTSLRSINFVPTFSHFFLLQRALEDTRKHWKKIGAFSRNGLVVFQFSLLLKIFP